MIPPRTRARQFAVQLLYQIHSAEQHTLGVAVTDLPRVFREFWAGVHETVDPDTLTFSETLVRGVVDRQQSINETVEKYAQNWKLSRMARVDLSILRLAVYELLYSSEVPFEVVINEAVELAKRFSTKDSSGFVNGILDKIAKENPLARGVSGLPT